MISGSVARRYARALLSIGQEHKNLELLVAELDRLAQTYERSADLRAVLENPVFSLAQRQGVLTDIARRLSLSPTTQHFAMLLLSRGRVATIPAIARQLRGMVDDLLGRVRVRVTSARPLEPASEMRLKTALHRATGRSVVLEKREDPSLLAGVVAQVGDLVYDGSLAHQLDLMRQRWLNG